MHNAHAKQEFNLSTFKKQLKLFIHMQLYFNLIFFLATFFYLLLPNAQKRIYAQISKLNALTNKRIPSQLN